MTSFHKSFGAASLMAPTITAGQVASGINPSGDAIKGPLLDLRASLTIEETTRIRLMGVHAAKASLAACPFKQGTPHRQIWMRGFQSVVGGGES